MRIIPRRKLGRVRTLLINNQTVTGKVRCDTLFVAVEVAGLSCSEIQRSRQA